MDEEELLNAIFVMTVQFDLTIKHLLEFELFSGLSIFLIHYSSEIKGHANTIPINCNLKFGEFVHQINLMLFRIKIETKLSDWCRTYTTYARE